MWSRIASRPTKRGSPHPLSYTLHREGIHESNRNSEIVYKCDATISDLVSGEITPATKDHEEENNKRMKKEKV